MLKVTKWVTGAAAGLAMMTTTAIADTSAAQSAADSIKPVSTDVSTQGSPPAWWPVYVALALSWDLGDDNNVRGGGGNIEDILISSVFEGLRLEFGWELALLSASSSAGSSFFGNLSPLFVLGVVAERNDIEALRQGGSTFPTTGDSEFTGFYTGLNINLFGNANTAASSSLAAVYWNAFANVGWGKATVDAFGGSFHRSETGLFYEIGTEMYFNLGYLLVGPAIVFRDFDNGSIHRDELSGELRFRIPIGR